MTHRQVRATFAVAAVIVVVAVVSVVAGAGNDDRQPPVEVGVIEPEPLHGDTVLPLRSESRDTVSDRKRGKKLRDAEIDHTDSPLRHKASRADLDAD